MNNELSIVIPCCDDALTEVSGRAAYRAGVALVESRIKEQPQVDIPLRHEFSKDVYAREISIPAGTLLTGKIHKHKNLNIISKGDVSFFSVDGSKRVQAPFMFVADPGVKRIIYAHADSVWTTIHGTSETDLKKIEDEFIAKDYNEIDGISDEELKLIEEAKKCLGL